MSLSSVPVLLIPAALLAVFAAPAPALGAERENSPCHERVQGRIAWDKAGERTSWNPSNIERLCRGAERSTAPALCFERIMHRNAAGADWRWQQALDLCAGTLNAGARIQCYNSVSATGMKREGAIESCRHVGGDSSSEDSGKRAPRKRRSAGCPDADGDSHRAAHCGGDDCDDRSAARFPGNAETCNDVDEDCDPFTLGGQDRDSDGFVSERCCNPQPDGSTRCGRDCDDTNAFLTPGAQVCAGRSSVRICGTGAEEACGSGLVCVSQPNGTGICVPQSSGQSPR